MQAGRWRSLSISTSQFTDTPWTYLSTKDGRRQENVNISYTMDNEYFSISIHGQEDPAEHGRLKTVLLCCVFISCASDLYGMDCGHMIL